MYNYSMTTNDIAEMIVPEIIKINSPQYFDLIKAFLYQVKDSITLGDKSFLDLINVERITSEDVLKIYIDTYLSTLNIDKDQENLVLIKDIIKVSKDLSTSKGTVFLFTILVNILKYLIEDIATTYSDLVNSLNNPNLSQSEKDSILEQIELQKDDEVGIIIDIRETSAYHYDIVTTLRFDFVEKHIIPFCHPVGWIYNLAAIVRKLFVDNSFIHDSLKITSTIKIPVPVVGDGNILAPFETWTDETDETWTDETDETWTSGNILSNHPYISNIFEFYYGHFYLGLESDLVDITGKIYHIDRIFVDNGKVYYDLREPTLLKELNNLNVNIIGGMNESFYRDNNQLHSLMYRVGGTFLGYEYIDELFFGNGLVVGGDRIIFKTNWDNQVNPSLELFNYSLDFSIEANSQNIIFLY